MLGDAWASTPSNLSANDLELKSILQSTYPDFLSAAETYGYMYNMSFTNALRFVLGASGSGYSAEMRAAVTRMIQNVEAGRSPLIVGPDTESATNNSTLIVAGIALALALMS